MLEFFEGVPTRRELESVERYQIALASFQPGQSGLIVVERMPTGRLMVLLTRGIPIRAFHVTEGGCSEVALDQLEATWPVGSATYQEVFLPRVAVRLLITALEWYPPAEIKNISSEKLTAHLDTYSSEGRSGLLRLRWDGSEAYLTLMNGTLLETEAVLVTSAGIQVGKNLSQVSFGSKDVEGALFIASTDSVSYQLLSLRYVMGCLLLAYLGRYQQLVGRNLADVLANNLTQLMLSKQYDIEVDREALRDGHIFPTVATATQAYRLLLKGITAYSANVIGAGLSSLYLMEAFNSLNPFDQKTLRDSPLMFSIVLSR